MILFIEFFSAIRLCRFFIMLLARVISIVVIFILCSTLYFGMYIISSVYSWGIFICVFVAACYCCCLPIYLWFHGARRGRCSTRDRRDFCPRLTMKYKVHGLWLLGWVLGILVACLIIGCFYVNVLGFRGSWFLITQGNHVKILIILIVIYEQLLL